MKRVFLATLILASTLPAPALGPKDGGSKNVAILLFPGVQIIDYTGPWEVLGHAYVNGQLAFRIYSVAQTTTPIETAMGMTVIPSVWAESTRVEPVGAGEKGYLVTLSIVRG